MIAPILDCAHPDDAHRGIMTSGSALPRIMHFNDEPPESMPSPGFGEALDDLVSAVIDHAIRNTPRDTRLEHVAQFAHSMLELAGQSPSPAEALAFARTMTRSILDQTPLPDQRFAIRRQPRPGRNDPCDCGSGRKFKQCCLQWENGAPPIPLENINFLPYVLAALPRKRWPELVGSSIDPRAVADAARQMIDDGDIEDARKLLEPWFKGEHAIPASHGELLLALLDVCDLQGKAKKKQMMFEQGILHGDRGIRSDMHQRLASIHADRGNMDLTWRHFQLAQREYPQDVSLSHLEVILLIHQGN